MNRAAQRVEAGEATIKVYELIRHWHTTAGAQGLRAVRLGRSLHIPRTAILEFLGIVRPHPEGQGVDRRTGGDRVAA